MNKNSKLLRILLIIILVLVIIYFVYRIWLIVSLTRPAVKMMELAYDSIVSLL